MDSARTRVEWLQSLPQNISIAEIGVFRGSFTKEILKYVKFERLVLIDAWKNFTEGDYVKDPCNKVDLQEAYEKVVQKVSSFENVTIIRDLSSAAAATLDFESFDVIYVDADHSYGGCLKDLYAYASKVKPGGVLAGHDYHNKAKHVDVIRAVTDFLKFHENFKLEEILSGDAYPSFVLRKCK